MEKESLWQVWAGRAVLQPFEQLPYALNEHIKKGLEPFYNQHLGLYLMEACFAEPPRIPDIYNDITGCILCDGKWMPIETLQEIRILSHKNRGYVVVNRKRLEFCFPLQIYIACEEISLFNVVIERLNRHNVIPA